jgi:CelD/BcsL family acetyltransferase involved in cellulose biosynthesis
LPSYASSPEITLTPLADLPALGDRWRALEAEADGGFFRGWRFVSQQAARFDNPQLLAVHAGGQDLALALLNRSQGRLWLNETGNSRQDAIFVEHNGMLVRRGAEAALAPALLALAEAGPVTLSGVDTAHAAAAAQVGRVREVKRLADPSVKLDALMGPYLDSLSANARGQIQRAMRLFGASLALSAAADTHTALAWFSAMAALHQAAWQRRGKPGAFADPDIVRFHEALISSAHPAGQADLLRIEAGQIQLGYLYNFRHSGRVYCYQSGFAAFTDARLKPGLVAHTLAIEHYRALGARVYDLLAGPARYKASLAPSKVAPIGEETLYWVELYARHSLRGHAVVVADRAKGWLRGFSLP